MVPTRRVLITSLLIIVGYATSRDIVYDLFGPLKSFDDWFARDTWMTIPRVLAFGACLWVSHCNGGFRQWGWSSGASRAGVCILFMTIGFEILYFSAGRSTHSLSPSQLARAWATTLPVALFEEACFRGLLFNSLKREFGLMKATLTSSLIFMVYHIQAQPIHDWPMIGCYGVLTCGALWRGAGLPWIVLSHEIIDSVWFHIFPINPLRHPEFHWIALGGAGLASCWVLIGMYTSDQQGLGEDPNGARRFVYGDLEGPKGE